jgi:hypothetical protein
MGDALDHDVADATLVHQDQQVLGRDAKPTGTLGR